MEENFLNTKMIPIRFSFRYFVIYINRFHYNVSLTLNAKLRQLVLITESGPEAIITEYNCHSAEWYFDSLCLFYLICWFGVSWNASGRRERVNHWDLPNLILKFKHYVKPLRFWSMQKYFNLFWCVCNFMSIARHTANTIKSKINLLAIKAYAKNTRILHQTFHLFPYYQIENLPVLVKFANNNCSFLYFYVVSKMQQGKW